MNPLMADRAGLQSRLLHWVDVVRALQEVDGDRIAAMGFCFGGLCALDLASTGVDVCGVDSVHGLLGATGNREGTSNKSRVIAFHGWGDQLAPREQVPAYARKRVGEG